MSSHKAEIKTTKRILWIDYAKFIGIFIIISGHQTTNAPWRDFISAFVIPLFFFLSGFLFSFKRFNSYSEFLKVRVKQLLIPYFLLNFVTYFLWLFFFRNFDHGFATTAPLYKSFIGIFYGNGYNSLLIHCVPSWFIICLFSLENIYFLVFRNLKENYKVIVLASFLLLCWAEFYHYRFYLPWGIDVAIIGLIFYGSANLFKGRVIQLVELSTFKLFIVSAIGLAVAIFIASRVHSDMNQHDYQDLRLFFVGAFAGIIFVITFCRIIEVLMGHLRILEFIAQNTIFIIAFHLMVGSLITKFILVVFNVSLEQITADGFIGLVVVVPTVILLIPLINLCNKYFPIMVGRPSVPATTVTHAKSQAAV